MCIVAHQQSFGSILFWLRPEVCVMFKDIVESVDALFSSKEYIDNGKVKKMY